MVRPRTRTRVREVQRDRPRAKASRTYQTTAKQSCVAGPASAVTGPAAAAAEATPPTGRGAGAAGFKFAADLEDGTVVGERNGDAAGGRTLPTPTLTL